MPRRKCKHGKTSSCRECHPQDFCEHGRKSSECGLCGGVSVLRFYKRNAVARGFTFELTREYFYWLISLPCIYCSRPSGGVDRVKNEFGYTTFNSVPCCSACNYMKQSRSAPEFYDNIAAIVSHGASYTFDFKQRWIAQRTEGEKWQSTSSTAAPAAKTVSVGSTRSTPSTTAFSATPAVSSLTLSPRAQRGSSRGSTVKAARVDRYAEAEVHGAVAVAHAQEPALDEGSEK